MRKIQILFLALFSVVGFLHSQGFQLVSGPSPMNVTRYNHASVSLPDGKVLVVGGHNQGFDITATAEIYDPSTGDWTLYYIDNPHDGCSYVQLNDGRFMFFGGFSSGGGSGQLAATTIFDPATSQFSNGPQMNVARAFSSAVTLTDGRVMIAGNWYNTGDVELFDPVTNTFTSVGVPVTERSLPLVFPCNDGGAVILGGIGVNGSPSYTDVVYYDPVGSQFTTLSTELINGETGWLAYWYGSYSPFADLKLSNGNYIFMIYKMISASEYQYAFAEFNPATKEVTKLNSTPAIPNYTGTSPNDWSYGMGITKDPSSDRVYVFGHGATTNPFSARLYAFDAQTGILEIPSGQTGFDYHLYSSSKAWVNGDILCTGGTIDGSNFNVTNQVNLLHPQNSLNVEQLDNTTLIAVYPNPISTDYFYVTTDVIGFNKIEIMDLKGFVVKDLSVDSSAGTHTIERGNLTNGIYILRVSGENGVYTKKILLH